MTLAPELVARAQAGDRASLEQVLAEVAPQVARFGRRICGDPTDAEDALQDTLLAVALHLPEYEGRASFSTWLFTLVRTACSRRRRTFDARPKESLDAAAHEASPAPSPESSAERGELRVALERALDALPEAEREVLALRDVEGLSATEAAAVLGISEAALKSRLHRARASLRERLAPVLEEGAPPRGPDCPDVLEALSRKLEDDLGERECALLEGHVKGCAACGAACDALREALDACHHLARPGARDALADAVRRAVAAWHAT